MTDSTMTEMPLVERLLEEEIIGNWDDGSASLGPNGQYSIKPATPRTRRFNRDGPEAAAMLKAAVDALEEARNYLRDEGRHRAIDQIRILDRLDNTLASLKQPGWV